MAQKPIKKKPQKKKNTLTPKQELFIREYLKDMNATQAYLRAGYKVSEKVAGTAGPRLLENVGIAAAIKKALGKRLNKLEISNDTVLQEIAKLAFSNMYDFLTIQEDGSATVDLSNLTREQAAAIQELSYEEGTDRSESEARAVRKLKFKLAEKRGSLELLGRYLKLFNDSTPINARQTAKILKDVLENKLTVREAAYKFNMLGLPIPEALKIELAKIEPEQPEPEVPPSLDDAELERRYQETLAKQDKEETEFVPQRREEVTAIKEELKDLDSFKPDFQKGASG